eukprot:4374964-Pleurochrysis_carterae.AAC.1
MSVRASSVCACAGGAHSSGSCDAGGFDAASGSELLSTMRIGCGGEVGRESNGGERKRRVWRKQRIGSCERKGP